MIAHEAEAQAYVAEMSDAIAMERLTHLAQALRDENERQNLVSRPSLQAIWSRHFADSAQLLSHVPRETEGAWLDLGTGAGLPGLIIAILQPKREVVLVESRKLRVQWLERMCKELDLANCRVEGARLENVESFPAAVISARAFAPLAKLLRLSARFSTDDTCWVLPKGRSAAQEVQELPKRLQSMFHVEHSVTDHEAGVIIGRGKVREAL